jgi:hypothetical protein
MDDSFEQSARKNSGLGCAGELENRQYRKDCAQANETYF